MKEDIFLQRMISHEPKEGKVNPMSWGPVITISREYGCYGSEIADKLCTKINAIDPSTEWKDISSEILEEASKKLNVNKEKISHIFGANETPIIEDILKAFSNYDKYTSDFRIKKTISNVVRSFAEKGNVVIVGRASCVLAHDIPRAIHVRLTASFEWRVNQIAKRFDIKREQAIEKVQEIDKHRIKFMEFYKGVRPDAEIYDVVYNRGTLSTDAIVEGIYNLVIQKNILNK